MNKKKGKIVDLVILLINIIHLLLCNLLHCLITMHFAIFRQAYTRQFRCRCYESCLIRNKAGNVKEIDDFRHFLNAK